MTGDNIDGTCAAMADTQQRAETTARADAARAKIADCDRRLANYRKTLDLGGPTATVVRWMAEVDAARLAAEQELGHAIPDRQVVRVEADLSHVDKSVSEGGLFHLRHARRAST